MPSSLAVIRYSEMDTKDWGDSSKRLQDSRIIVQKSTPFSIQAQDANSRVWQSVDYKMSSSGEIIPVAHSYVELASGLNHLVNGRWVESSEFIDILPNGTAVATNGQHQVYFPGDIYHGKIELVTTDGKHLKVAHWV